MSSLFVARLKHIDWDDVFIHVAITLLLWPLLYYGHALWGQFPAIPSDWLLLFNTAIWPIREALQHKPDYKEIITHPQSLLEWVAPVLTGAFLYWILP